MMSPAGIFELCLNVFLLLAAVSIVLIFLSLVKGPKLEDRVVAIDVFTSLILSSIAVYSVYTDNVGYLDAAIILALFAFVGTVIFARFIEKDSGEKA